MISAHHSDSLTSACFYGCDDGSSRFELDSERPADIELRSRIENAIMTVIRNEDCHRFIISSVNGFEAACIKILLGQVLQNDELIQSINEVEILLILPPDARLDESIRCNLLGWLPSALKVPVTVSPYIVEGAPADQITEMLELSDAMICFVPNAASDQTALVLDYARDLGITVTNLS